jgi:putative hydrolase of the HAD superfamily
MPQKYKYLFFDLDRTLWDYDANSAQALTGIYEDYQLNRHFDSNNEFLSVYNHHNDQLWDDYRNGFIKKEELRTKRFELTLREKKIDDPKLCVEIGERYMYVTPRLNMLAPNTMMTLEYLWEMNYRLYILTNGFLSTQKKKMAFSEIDKFFIRIFSSEEIGVNKPRKGIFHWAVSSIHAHKRECLMVGDDLEVDIRGAMNYGIDAVWYNPGQTKSEFIPTYTITDIGELTQLL